MGGHAAPRGPIVKIGDYVWLVSGGPRMKVRAMPDDDKIECVWRGGTRVFHPKQLTEGDPEPGRDWSGDDA